MNLIFTRLRWQTYIIIKELVFQCYYHPYFNHFDFKSMLVSQEYTILGIGLDSMEWKHMNRTCEHEVLRQKHMDNGYVHELLRYGLRWELVLVAGKHQEYEFVCF